MDKKVKNNYIELDEIPDIPEIRERFREEKKPVLLERKKKKSVQGLVLLAVILIACGILAGVNGLLANSIERQKYEKKQKVYREIFSEGASFENMELDNGAGENYLKESGYTGNEIDSIVCIKNKSDMVIGKIYNVLGKDGYGGSIMVSLGIMNSGVICGAEIMEISEMEGFSSIDEQESFMEQFLYKKAETFTYLKNGTASNGILSVSEKEETEAVLVKTVNAAILLDSYYTGEGAEANE